MRCNLADAYDEWLKERVPIIAAFFIEYRRAMTEKRSPPRQEKCALCESSSKYLADFTALRYREFGSADCRLVRQSGAGEVVRKWIVDGKMC